MIIPLFIDVKLNISPGVVSTFLSIFWMVFISILTKILVKKAYIAYNLNFDKNRSQLYITYKDTSNISNGFLYDMIKSILLKNSKIKKRLILGFILWMIIYILKEIFSLSINNSLILVNGEKKCAGFIKEKYIITDNNWISFSTSNYVPSNITQIKTLLNFETLENIVMLGNGMFTTIPYNTIVPSGEKISVNKVDINCTYHTVPDAYLSDFGYILGSDEINTTNFKGIYINNIIKTAYSTNILLINHTHIYGNTKKNDSNFLLLISNSINALKNNSDINYINNNTHFLLCDCNILYTNGYIINNKTGYLNKSNINNNYHFLRDMSDLIYKPINAKGDTTNVIYKLIYDNKLFSPYDYPDILLDINYNKTFKETLSYANDIIASRLLSSIDPKIDSCLITNYNETNSLIYITGTRFSLGYIILAILIPIFIIILMFIFLKNWQDFVMFTQLQDFIDYVNSSNEESSDFINKI